jgi:hypothetical protein
MAAGSEEGALVASAVVMLLRYRRAYTDLPPPKELQRLLDRLFCAEGVYLYAH